MHRCVVTGVGVIAPGGKDFSAFWQSVTRGQTAIGPLRGVDAANLTVKIAAEVAGYDPADHFDSKRLALLDPTVQFGLVAAREAVAASGLDIARADLARPCATIIGTGAGGQQTQDEAYLRVYGEGAKRVHPFTIPRLMLNAVASQITMEFGLHGPAFVTSSACASANHAIGQAAAMIRAGQVSVAITGGAEACIAFGVLKSWDALRVMADDTCRPFSKGRRGMVIGEGAAMFVLEAEDHALSRGAPILAEIAGFGMSADAHDILAPDEQGAARAMQNALDDAALTPADIDYINAHGTGTTANDVTETAAIRRVFGGDADRLAVSSTKAVHGHAMGAAGALELAVTIGALRDRIVPPTANFTVADPACDLDYVPHDARPRDIRAALSNSFAFGGLNAVLAVKRYEGE